MTQITTTPTELPIWRPDQARIENSLLHQFMQDLRQQGLSLKGYTDLYQWSVQESPAFWASVWDFFGIISEHRGGHILRNSDQMPGATWFPDARLNFAENLLRFRDERTALVFVDELGDRQSLTYAELYLRTAQVAKALQQHGVEAGDRIAGLMPNCIETIIAMLATTSLGAVWSSCSPDFGVQGVLDRFGQIAPKVLFTVNGYYYNGKTIDISAKVTDICGQLDSLNQVVIQPMVADLAAPDICKSASWHDFIANDANHIDFVQRSFNDPVYIMFSSGTTGVPKCIVHSIGGTLLQHVKEHGLHGDLQRNDNLFYFTTCGWMMWNWMVSGLALGAQITLFDGSPFYPTPQRMMDLIDAEQITHFGTSAKYLAALEKAGEIPKQTHDLKSLKTIFTTGSVLPPESFDYVYQSVKSDVCLSSISGGTDIISCFALGNPILPVYRGQLQCRGLGLAVNVYNDEGNPVLGEKGELVCEQPFPSMPIGFWNDSDGRRYRSAYFDRFDNVWAHGDYAELTAQDGVIIYGRSDTVLNPGGVRIGTAEIYRQVEKVDAVLESIAVGQQFEGDERVVLFVKLRDSVMLTDELRQRIKDTIRANATPRHVPAVIAQVVDIPRTISGKITELAVRQVIHGETVKNTDALANPEALEYFRNLPELHQ